MLFAPTHDLRALRSLVSPVRRVPVADEELRLLTEWVVAGRYPVDGDEAVRADAEVALRTAQAVVDAVLADMRARGVEPEAAK